MGLFSRNKSKPPLFPLTKDIHSHIIPGIDDGAKNVDESLNMIREFIRQGYEKIITTPHIHSERYLNNSEEIKNSFEALMERVDKENLNNIKIEYCAEYFADMHLLKLLDKDDIMPFGGNHILVEFSFHLPPVNPELFFDKLSEAGYQPVLAHPERYEYWHGNLSLFQKLKNTGYLFQSNMHAAAGFYGHIAKSNFDMFASNEMIDFLGTDAHSPEAVKKVEKTMQLKSVQNVLKRGIRNIYL